MKSPSREVDSVQIAFFEAQSDLRPQLALRGQSITTDPGKHVSQIPSRGIRRLCVPPPHYLKPGARSQKAIQSP
jgi:hypothetical protein